MATTASDFAKLVSVTPLSKLSDALGDFVRDGGHICEMVMDRNWKVSITQLRHVFSELMSIARSGRSLPREADTSRDDFCRLRTRLVMMQPLLAYAEARGIKGANSALRQALLPLTNESRYQGRDDFAVLESLMTAFIDYQKLRDASKDQEG